VRRFTKKSTSLKIHPTNFTWYKRLSFSVERQIADPFILMTVVFANWTKGSLIVSKLPSDSGSYEAMNNEPSTFIDKNPKLCFLGSLIKTQD
jgi:hypothetical protein